MNIGFIGLGHMGGAMARNLLKAGHHVILHNRTPSTAEAPVTSVRMDRAPSRDAR